MPGCRPSLPSARSILAIWAIFQRHVLAFEMRAAVGRIQEQPEEVVRTGVVCLHVLSAALGR